MGGSGSDHLVEQDEADAGDVTVVLALSGQGRRTSGSPGEGHWMGFMLSICLCFYILLLFFNYSTPKSTLLPLVFSCISFNICSY